MPNRKYSASLGYRYGFNGKEEDDEIKGDGNQYDYGFRIYDPRIGRFLSIDPLSKDYPFYTPYQFAGNKPIANIDVDGLEDRYYMLDLNLNSKGELEMTGYKEIEHRRAGNYKEGNREWTVPVGPLGKGDAVFVNLSYNINPGTVTTEELFAYFEPRKKTWWERLLTPTQDDDIGSGYYLTSKSGGSGDPFGPGAKRVDNIPNADQLLSLIGGGDKGFIKAIIKNHGAEKITSFLTAFKSSMETGEDVADIYTMIKSKLDPDPNTIYCKACRGNFIGTPAGTTSNEPSNKPAGDTTESHVDIPKNKLKTQTKEAQIPQKKKSNH